MTSSPTRQTFRDNEALQNEFFETIVSYPRERDALGLMNLTSFCDKQSFNKQVTFSFGDVLSGSPSNKLPDRQAFRPTNFPTEKLSEMISTPVDDDELSAFRSMSTTRRTSSFREGQALRDDELFKTNEFFDTNELSETNQLSDTDKLSRIFEMTSSPRCSPIGKLPDRQAPRSASSPIDKLFEITSSLSKPFDRQTFRNCDTLRNNNELDRKTTRNDDKLPDRQASRPTSFPTDEHNEKDELRKGPALRRTSSEKGKLEKGKLREGQATRRTNSEKDKLREGQALRNALLREERAPGSKMTTKTLQPASSLRG
ncbi:hypothetical protein BJ508DRAFT_312741 [Ascobolus immersus RN42]|uniref:Uncharacterized protein n=1 Tax=Ascobolus immersus RN42 TaxID=1160509 RepID=A0A3N4HL85_ASCIM|nr:hypothetical protein BJ508DRAFT_312741 [Ascobolus immersus RN42]